MKNKFTSIFMCLIIIMITGLVAYKCYGAMNEKVEIQFVDLYTQSHLDETEEMDNSTEAYEAASTEYEAEESTETESQVNDYKPVEDIEWDENWEYAGNSKIHTDGVTLYHALPEISKGYVVAVNAGHGTKNGSSVKTLCHPDGTPKVTGGSTAAGEIYATAVSGGMSFTDGTLEAKVNLSMAILLKDELLKRGYDVLMIRESDDVQLDNIARTVFANNNADCHLALHYDSSENDKGFFCIEAPNVDSYKKMEPVASHWQSHHELGESIIEGALASNIKIYQSGFMRIDLTQISYSTIPSIDIEVGDKGSDYSEKQQTLVAKAIVDGLDLYFKDR